MNYKTKLDKLITEAHKNSTDKHKQINILIDEVRPLVKTIGDAVVLIPIIKDYLQVGVKNDDLLIKIAIIVQKQLQGEPITKEEETFIEEELNDLMRPKDEPNK